jgi:hypothetical protein
LHALRHPAHRSATWWLAAIVGCSLALSLAIPATSHADEANPNNYSCLGHLSAGKPEVGSEEQQVQYTFYCDGPITGYQLQSQVPVTGVEGAPLVTSIPAGTPLSDTFACSGEVPGYALNCVGAAKVGYETITGQFAIGSKLCVEPRVDVLLTVTYAYLEKGVVTQAISGPIDLGRPEGCPPDFYSGATRLSPKPPIKPAGKGKHAHKGKHGGPGKGHGGPGKGKGKKTSKKRA